MKKPVRTIQYITPELISDPHIVTSYIYENMENDYYWTSDWSPDFYIELAFAGFISVAMNHEELGYILLPEIQKAYAVLDWENLHLSGNIKKLIRMEVLKGYSLKITKQIDPVVCGITNTFGAESWLSPPYIEVLKTLSTTTRHVRDFSLIAVELRESADNRLAAGELGYVIGKTYTSLSGFFVREEKKYNHMGTVQLLCLARILEQKGFAFWNLGHPHLLYKTALGAGIFQRRDFLSRWIKVRNQKLVSNLSGIGTMMFSCQDILGPLITTNSMTGKSPE